MCIISFFVLGFSDLDSSQRYCPKSDPRLRGKFGNRHRRQRRERRSFPRLSGLVTEGNEETGNPCETIGVFTKRTKARKEQANFKLRFPSPGILYRRKRRK